MKGTWKRSTSLGFLPCIYRVKTFRFVHDVFSHKSALKSFVSHTRDKGQKEKYTSASPAPVATISAISIQPL